MSELMNVINQAWPWLALGFILPTVITALVTPLVIKLYRRCGWDKPHGGARQSIKNTHHGNIPRGGGLAIGLGMMVMIVGMALLFPELGLSMWLGGICGREWAISPMIIAIYVGALVLMVVGVLDDIFDLSPVLRLIINILVALGLVMGGLQINFVTNPWGVGVWDLTSWWWLPAAITVFYVVALTNITNWAKGVDGQLPGVVVIAALIIGGVSIRLTGDLNYGWLLSFLVAGSFLGFLWWNFYPQKIMPGFGGGALAGYFLAVISMIVGAKIATLFMVLALPIADAIFTIARRMVAGKSIFLGDRGHLHHKLLDKLGWGRRRIALFYYLVTLVMGVLALILPTWGKIAAFVVVTGLVFYFLIMVKLKSLHLV